MKLIYRGYTFDYSPRPIQPYRKPNALNWRWQAPGEIFESNPRPVQQYRQPRALNWRFKLQEDL